MGIKLEAGKRYVSRGGHVYGPLYAVKSSRFPFECRAASERWTPDGDYHDDGEECICDLIALAPDEAPEPPPDELAALRARVAELQQEIAAIRREAETNQKWAFLEWRDRAERAEAENARLREALQFAVNQMRTVRDGKTGGIPNDIIALLPEAIEMADIALAKLRGTK